MQPPLAGCLRSLRQCQRSLESDRRHRGELRSWSSEQSASSYSSQLRPAVSEAASPPLVSQRVHRTVSPSRGSAIPRTSLLSDCELDAKPRARRRRRRAGARRGAPGPWGSRVRPPTCADSQATSASGDDCNRHQEPDQEPDRTRAGDWLGPTFRLRCKIRVTLGERMPDRGRRLVSPSPAPILTATATSPRRLHFPAEFAFTPFSQASPKSRSTLLAEDVQLAAAVRHRARQPTFGSRFVSRRRAKRVPS